MGKKVQILETSYKIHLYIKILGGGEGSESQIGHHKIGAWPENGQNRIWGGWGVKKTH